jgi:hypothetical protein
LLLSAVHCPAVGSPRVRELFDFDWRFTSSDPAGAETRAFDDRQWQPVDLPHDFAICGPFEENVKNGNWNGFRPLGIGWYRKTFASTEDIRGRRIWLDLEPRNLLWGGYERAMPANANFAGDDMPDVTVNAATGVPCDAAGQAIVGSHRHDIGLPCRFKVWREFTFEATEPIRIFCDQNTPLKMPKAELSRTTFRVQMS